MTADSPPLATPARRFRLQREHGLLVLFIITALALSLGVEYFATRKNILTLLQDQAPLAVLSVGMTLVILTGGIDLSVGSITALSAMCMGLAWKSTGSGVAALAAGFGVGAICGACNGLLFSAGRVPPLIVTLATLYVFRGLAFAVAGSNAIGGFDPLVLFWSRSEDALLRIPVPVWISAALFIGVAIYLARTDGGRAIYATGANAAAARLSGVPVKLLNFRIYLVSGLLSGLAAVFYAARNNSVKPDIGNEYELLAITMVVLGGTSVAGGEGSIAGTALGYLTLVFIQKGIQLKGMPPEYHGVVVAGLLIGALLLDAGVRRRASRV
jgi:ribose/xylose/arabinose/galactoside ABC-type transport system permease subunit